MKELLFSVFQKDFRVDTFRSGGKGGQNQNKRDTGVRIVHLASGAVGESREERSQHQNKMAAFKRLVKTKQFTNWVRIEAAKKTGRAAEMKRQVEESINDARNIKIERKNAAGFWEECSESDLT